MSLVISSVIYSKDKLNISPIISEEDTTNISRMVRVDFFSASDSSTLLWGSVL